MTLYGSQAPGWPVSDLPHAYSPESRRPGKWGVFPREQNKPAVGRKPDVHRASSLLLRLSAHPRPTHTGAAMGRTPLSLSSLPHPSRLGLRVRKLEPMNPDATFKRSINFTHHREPPCHLPYHRAPCFPLCSLYTTLALPLSFHASSVPTGAGDMESTEMLLPPSGSQASRRDGHRI